MATETPQERRARRSAIKPGETLYSEKMLSPEIRAAIGCVAVESARLEVAVERAVWLCAGLDMIAGAILTARLSMSARLGLLRKLAAERVKPPDAIVDVVDKIGKGAATRNLVIHGSWTVSVQHLDFLAFLSTLREQSLHRGEAKVTSRRGSTPVTLKAEEMQELARKIGALYNELSLAMQESGFTIAQLHSFD